LLTQVSRLLKIPIGLVPDDAIHVRIGCIGND